MSKAFGYHPFLTKCLVEITNRFYQGINTVADKLEYAESGYPIIQAKHITGKYLDLDDVRYVSAANFSKYKDKYRPAKGDLLLSNIGTIGKSCLIKQEVDFLIAWNVFLISLNEGSDPAFVNYLLEQLDQSNFYDDLVTGNATKFINKSTLGAIEIPHPPLPEQQKIAAILTAVDEVIESTQAQINKLKDLKAGLMQELLSKGIGHTEFKDSPVGRIPKAWEIVKLGSVLDKIDSGWSPNCIEIPPNIGEWGVLKVSAVTRDVFLEEQSKTLPAELEPKESCRVRKNDILLTRANGVANLVGKCVMIRDEPKRKLMMSDKILRLSPNAKVNPDFLLHIFNSTVIRKQIEFCWGGSSGQKNIGQADIKIFLLPLLPLAEQSIIGNSITNIEKSIFQKNKKYDHLVSIKKALMQDLLTGKVRVKTA